MAMSSTRVKPMDVVKTLSTVALLSLGLGGCMTPEKNLTQDFGAMEHQAIVAQIADPDVRYVGKPAPGSDGARVATAQKRYATPGKVIKPARESQPAIPNGESQGADDLAAGPGAGGAAGGATSAGPPQQ